MLGVVQLLDPPVVFCQGSRDMKLQKHNENQKGYSSKSSLRRLWWKVTLDW